MPRSLPFSLSALALLLLLPAAARADVATFNFEGPAGFPAGLTSVALTQGGLTMTITREGGARFDIINNFPGTDPAFGTRSLTPGSVNDTAAFIANFSQPVTAITIDMGDFGVDVDTLLLEAYSGPDGTGALLASHTLTLTPQPGNTFSFLTLSVAAGGINSIRFIGGGPLGPNSVFYDNFTVTFTPQAVPEPATVLLLATGLAGVAARARRRRKV